MSLLITEGLEENEDEINSGLEVRYYLTKQNLLVFKIVEYFWTIINNILCYVELQKMYWENIASNMAYIQHRISMTCYIYILKVSNSLLSV